jgi:hypothetical protein
MAISSKLVTRTVKYGSLSLSLSLSLLHACLWLIATVCADIDQIDGGCLVGLGWLGEYHQ